MAGRRKRDSVPGGEVMPGAGVPTNNVIPDACATPVAEERIEVVAIEVPAESPGPPNSGPGKASGRKPRKQKAVAEAAIVPSVPPSVGQAEALSAPPLPFFSDVTESLRQVMERCKEVQEQLGTVRLGLKDVSQEMNEMRERSRELKQELKEAGGSLAQLGAVRQGLQEATRELDEMREQAQAVKQGLREAGQSLGHLHQIRTVQEELQDAGRQASGIKEQSGNVRQELQEIQGVMAALRQELETTREDLKTRMREAGARFFAIGEACQDLKREMNETQEQIKSLRPPTPEGIAVLEPAVVLTPVSANGKSEQAAIVDEHGSPISEPHFPEMELDHPASSHEAKKLLGLTVAPDATVVEVLPDTPAEKAGLQVGDVVVSLDGNPVANSEELRTAIEKIDADKEVLLTVTRGQETQAISVQLATAMDVLAGVP